MSLMMPVTTVPSMMTRPIDLVLASPACTASGWPPSKLSITAAPFVAQLVPFALASARVLPLSRLAANTASPPVSSTASDRTVMVLAWFRSILAVIDWIGIALPAKVSVRAERS
ncbi:hypothetical protein GCM10008965_16610 [Methylorubrum aminovorans]